MQQLTGLDASFLNMETPTMSGHVASMIVFERGGATEGSFEAISDVIRQRLSDEAGHVFGARLGEYESGVSNCSMAPARMIASRSPRAKASAWSWVTKTAVK